MSRINFGSRLGVVAAAAGSAVGLGNIWRFPYELGQNGGAAFLLLYMLFVVLLGLPIMLTEFMIGRMGQQNITGTFRNIGHEKWRVVGYAGVLCAFFIMGFYCVVAGWTLEYLWQAVTNQFVHKTVLDLSAAFTDFSSQTVRPIIWLVLFMVIACYIILAGVTKGIERSSKMLMPILVLLIIMICFRSVSLPGGMEGLLFLFKPDFSKLTSTVILNAMGQAFFSLSLGMGCMITYGSYISKKNNLANTTMEVICLDTIIAILAAIAIFPAVFALDINPAQGPELVFVTLPHVFTHISGGYIWAVVFFFLLAIAALTSAISLLEVITAFLSEEFKVSRAKSAIGATVFICLLGVLSSLSLGVWRDVRILGMGFFGLFDNFTAKILMPIGAMSIAIFAGWVLDKKRIEVELSNKGSVDVKYIRLYIFLLKYLVPLAIFVVFLNQLNLW